MTWKRLASTTVHKGKYVEVSLDEVEIDNGEIRKFTVVHKDPGVLIIPWDGTHFTLVGQYRYPIDTYHWEFPQGHVEGHLLEKAAALELKEETGFVAGKLESIGKFFLAAGHHTQECHVFLASNLTQEATNHEVSEEGMSSKLLSLHEFEQEIAQGLITDAPTLAAFALFKVTYKS